MNDCNFCLEYEFFSVLEKVINLCDIFDYCILYLGRRVAEGDVKVGVGKKWVDCIFGKVFMYCLFLIVYFVFVKFGIVIFLVDDRS